MKRILSVMLIISLLCIPLLSLTACGDTDDVKDGTDTETGDVDLINGTNAESDSGEGSGAESNPSDTGIGEISGTESTPDIEPDETTVTPPESSHSPDETDEDTTDDTTEQPHTPVDVTTDDEGEITDTPTLPPETDEDDETTVLPPETDDETDKPDETTITPPDITPDTTPDTTPPEDYTEVKYAALGDSICRGFGLNDAENERYSTLIEHKINALKDYRCDCYNYGVDGITSDELLASINKNDMPGLVDADVVTISIGANNVLAPATGVLSKYYIYSMVQDENLKRQFLSKLVDEFDAIAHDGAAQLENDIDKIIKSVRSLAPDAQIIFQTIYNPYKSFDIELDLGSKKLDIADYTDTLVTQLNNIIKSYSKKLDYDIADVYSEFEDKYGVVNAETTVGKMFDLETAFTKIDPHPSASGHILIADIIYPLIKLG